MGIERFFTQSIAVYAFTASGTWPYDNAWSAITGSPFKGSFTELSGDRAKVGGATEARADGFFCLPSSVAVLSTHKIKWNSRTFEIVMPPKIFPEFPGHHQEVYVKESPEAVI
jgi:hypothetical protein